VKGYTNIALPREGRKADNGGKTAHFFVAISYGKSVVMCEPYEELDGEMFAKFVKKHFPIAFRRSCKPLGSRQLLARPDGDPSQNSKNAKLALANFGATQLSIPPRSPDCNPIENFFALIGRRLMTLSFASNSQWSRHP